MSTEQVNTGNGGKIIVGVVIAGLLSAVIFLFIQNRNLSTQTSKGEEDITKLSDEITDLEKEIEDYKVDIANKELSNAKGAKRERR